MKLTTGPMQHWERFPGDKLAYDHADLLDESGVKVGAVHQSGYAPRWAYQFTQFRWRQPGFAGPFDGAAFDTAEQARETAERALKNWLDKLVR